MKSFAFFNGLKGNTLILLLIEREFKSNGAFPLHGTVRLGSARLTYGAFPLHGTVRYGSLQLALNGTTSVEVPSVPYRY